MEIVREEDKEVVARRAVEALNLVLGRHQQDPVLLLLAGGSWFGLLNRVDTHSFSEDITIGMSDERYSEDAAVNNFAQLEQTEFYRLAKEKGVRYINTKVQDKETISEFTARFEEELKVWKEKNPQGRVIITQGIGLDGHTCGIMPYPENPELFQELFENSVKWVVGYDADEKNEYPYRVTITLSFLREMVNHSIIYAVGENKKEALGRILSGEGLLAATPARIIHEMRDVQLFTDIVQL